MQSADDNWTLYLLGISPMTISAVPIHPELLNSIRAKACYRPSCASQDKFAAINMAPLAEFDESRLRKSAVVADKGRFHAIPIHPELRYSIPAKLGECV